MSGRDPYCNIVDIIVTAMTDNHCRQFSNSIDLFLDKRPSFFFGVPHHTKDEAAYEYYLYGINRLKNKLEEFTAIIITDAKLKKAIELCNREREFFRKISEMRKSKDSAGVLYAQGHQGNDQGNGYLIGRKAPRQKILNPCSMCGMGLKIKNLWNMLSST